MLIPWDRLRRQLSPALMAFAVLGAAATVAHAQYAAPSGPEPAGAAEDAGDLPALLVTSVEVLRGSGDVPADIVRVYGVTSSEGWTNPQLVPTYAGRPGDDVLDLQLVATPPGRERVADGFMPVSAILVLAPDHPYKAVRVRGGLNAVTVASLPGIARADVTLDDCKACVGKRFVPRGGSAGSGEAVVREEDLPKGARILRPADGIRGADFDPDRLTLVLDDKDVVVKAFWE